MKTISVRLWCVLLLVLHRVYPSSQSYGFSSGHVWMWELDYKESWAPRNWCFWTGVLEKTLESPSDCKEIKPVNPKGNQSGLFVGRVDAEAKAPLLWPPDVKQWLIGKDPDPGKDWRQEEKGMTEDEMVGWHHRFDGHEFEQALGIGDRQGSLACCSPWGRKESDTTEWLNWTDIQISHMYLWASLVAQMVKHKLLSTIQMSVNNNNKVVWQGLLFIRHLEHYIHGI